MQYFRADGIDHGKPGCRAIRSPHLDADAEPATPPSTAGARTVQPGRRHRTRHVNPVVPSDHVKR
jgi:hypothetical protein